MLKQAFPGLQGVAYATIFLTFWNYFKDISFDQHLRQGLNNILSWDNKTKSYVLDL